MQSEVLRGNQSSSELIRAHHLMGIDEELVAREQLGDAIEARRDRVQIGRGLQQQRPQVSAARGGLALRTPWKSAVVSTCMLREGSEPHSPMRDDTREGSRAHQRHSELIRGTQRSSDLQYHLVESAEERCLRIARAQVAKKLEVGNGRRVEEHHALDAPVPGDERAP